MDETWPRLTSILANSLRGLQLAKSLTLASPSGTLGWDPSASTLSSQQSPSPSVATEELLASRSQTMYAVVFWGRGLKLSLLGVQNFCLL